MSGGWPAGYAVRNGAGSSLIALEDRMNTLVEAGFDDPATWEHHLCPGRASGMRGRGASAMIELGGLPLHLKRLRRGGLAAALWCDRFAGIERLRLNLVVPVEAARRGVATPLPVALLIVAGPPGLFRGWLATEQVADAVDLLGLLRRRGGLDRPLLAAPLAAVRRMHDLGVEHRDLNLGNLLVRESSPEEVWIIDLDRARLHAGPLSWRLRRRALERLARSWVKSMAGAPLPVGVALPELYAAADPVLAARLARGRRLSRCRLALHRLGWRR